MQVCHLVRKTNRDSIRCKCITIIRWKPQVIPSLILMASKKKCSRCFIWNQSNAFCTSFPTLPWWLSHSCSVSLCNLCHLPLPCTGPWSWVIPKHLENAGNLVLYPCTVFFVPLVSPSIIARNIMIALSFKGLILNPPCAHCDCFCKVYMTENSLIKSLIH